MSWRRKSRNDWGRLGMKCELGAICTFRKSKTEVAGLRSTTYISTENMLPNKGGIIASSSLPSCLTTQEFQTGDVLVSNIRPYFKKIWLAEFGGGCSNDVLVFTANKEVDPIFLYYVLSDNTFFTYATATAKGTKMPRGDRAAIMQYRVPQYDFQIQKKIGVFLRSFDEKIRLNNKINENLEQQAQAIYKSWFVDFEPFGGAVPTDWREYKLSEFLPVITGKKNANVASDKGKYPFFSCSQDFSWTDEYSFEGNAILVAGNGDFNVKWYNGKFEAYQRTYVLIPYNPQLTSWLYYAVKYNLAKITSAARGSVIKFITKGNLENFSFYAPASLEKLGIVNTIELINQTIDCNIQENYRLMHLRDILLPKLMSGEIDVSNLQL